MQITDLVAIGKLGNSIDENGFISFKKNSNFQQSYLTKKDVFLLFKDHRVRYVSIDKVINEKRFKLRFLETDVTEEAADAGGVRVTIPESDLVKFNREADFVDPVGMKVIFNKKELGNVINFFNNSVYDILIVETGEKKEIMIPDVDKYVIEKNAENDTITVKNIDGLMDL